MLPQRRPAQCKRPPPPGYRDITVAGTLKVDRLVSTSLQYAFNPAAMDVIVTGTMIYTAEAENMDGGPRLTDLEANIDLRNGIRVDLSRDPPPAAHQSRERYRSQAPGNYRIPDYASGRSVMPRLLRHRW